MIQLFNIESQAKVLVPYQGRVDAKIVSVYIRKNSKQLAFVGALDDSLIYHNANQKGILQLITRNWFCTLNNSMKPLHIRIKSNDYLCKLQELHNTVYDLRCKLQLVKSNTEQFVKKVEMRHQPKEKIFEISLMWASPLSKDGGVTKYQTKYDIVFKSIMQLIQQSKKNVKLNAEEFNKRSFISNTQNASVIYINAHSEKIYESFEVFGESKEGGLEKFGFCGDEFEEEKVDLIILHSSCTEDFAQKIEKVTRNLIVISSNVYCQDQSVYTFNESLFKALLQGASIQTSFNQALNSVKNKKNLVLTQCCCFHAHNHSCTRKNIVQLTENDTFSRYHKKCHLYQNCDCPQQKTDRLIHLSTCTKFGKRIIPSYTPRESNGQLSYCCCPEITQEHERRTGELLHSLSNKFQLRKTTDQCLHLQPGKCSSSIQSEYFIQPKLSLVETRKHYLSKCLMYIHEKLRQTTVKELLIRFYGSEDKEELSDYLFTVLLRKKFIKPTQIKIEDEWRCAETDKIMSLIRDHSFIIIKIEIKNLEEMLLSCASNELKIVIVISETTPAPCRDSLDIQFVDRTPGQNLIALKRNISSQQIPYIERFKLYNPNGKPDERNVQMKIEYEIAVHSIDQQKLRQIKNDLQMYDLALIISYFGKVSEKTLEFLERCVVEDHKKNISVEFMVSYKQLLFTISEDQMYVLKPSYLKAFKYSERVDSTLKNPMIEKICYRYFFKLLLSQTLNHPRSDNTSSEKCGLYEATTLNTYSLLSLFLDRREEVEEIDAKPSLSIDEIFSFAKALIEMKIKTDHRDFQLVVILILNHKLKDPANIKEASEQIWEIQNIFKFQNPVLSEIFRSFIIQTRLHGLHQQKKEQYAGKIQRKFSLSHYQISDNIYKYVVSFDILIGHTIIFSKWWNVITDLSQISRLRQYYREYQKNRSEAFSSKNATLFHRIDELHSFKLNFLKMLVNNKQFQMMYRPIFQTPTKQIKLRYKSLATYLWFLKKRDKIQNIPKEVALNHFWDLYDELKTKYQTGTLKFIKQKLVEELLAKITLLTNQVCYILKSFWVRQKQTERTVIVDYNLIERITRLGFTVKQLPLNRINLNYIMTVRCKYLVFWFEEEVLGEKEQIACLVDDQDPFLFSDFKKELQSADNEMKIKIEHAIICSSNASFRDKMLQAITKLQDQPIKNCILFDFSSIDPIKQKDPEERSYKKKLIMNICVEKIIQQIEQNPHEEIRQIIGRISSGICNLFQIQGNFLTLETAYKSRGGYKPIEITNTHHAVYKGMMQQVTTYLKALKKPKQKNSSVRMNTVGDPINIGHFLNFFQKICTMNNGLFPGGIYKVDCKELTAKDLPLSFIEEKLGVCLPTLKHKKALVILQNFDKITKETSGRKTYDYLLQLLTNDQDNIYILATSEKPIDQKFHSTDDKKYQNPKKSMDYERKIIKN